MVSLVSSVEFVLKMKTTTMMMKTLTKTKVEVVVSLMQLCPMSSSLLLLTAVICFVSILADLFLSEFSLWYFVWYLLDENVSLVSLRSSLRSLSPSSVHKTKKEVPSLIQ